MSDVALLGHHIPAQARSVVLYLLTPSSVIMWLCFDMTVAMCMVCVCILLPIHALLQPDCSLMGEFQDIMNFEL